MTKMTGKSALVTGAANGIGLAICRKLLLEGWEVTATDIDLAALKNNLGSETPDKSGTDIRHLELCHLDISDASAWNQVLDQTIKNRGKIDLLVNNAGIIHPAWVADCTPEMIDRHIDVNLRGNMYGTSLGAARMRRQGFGHIVNIASLAGIAPVTGLGAYVASKFGLRGFSLAAALELKSEGIAVTVICPDLVRTGMLTSQLDHGEAALSFSGPRALQPAEIAEAVMRAVRKRPIEITIPASRGLLAKISSMAPGLAGLLRNSLTNKGKRHMEKLKKEKRDLN